MRRFDRAAFLSRVGGDDALVAEVIALFRDDCPRALDAIRTATTAGDAPAVQRAAHALKGAAGSLSAGPVTEVARQLEAVAQSGDLSRASSLCDQLDREAARLLSALEAS